MNDLRLLKMAQVLVRYSLALKAGDLFLIQGSDLAAPLIRNVYREALLAGAHPYLKVTVDGIAEILYNNASDEQLQYISDLQKLEIEKIDAMLTIMGTHNTRNLSGIDPQRIAIQKRAGLQQTKRMLERISEQELRWCGTQFPTQASAQDAEMSLFDYENFLFTACAVEKDDPVEHWRRLRKDQDSIIQFLSQCKELHVTGVDTDLKFSVAGRKWINCAGTENFPDGEVFTGPVEDSVNGHICFTYPAVYQNREVVNVRLTFENGQVVKAEASKGLDFLKTMIEIDDGASFVGEFAFGTNRGITGFTRNTLFDEKIGGTIHLALGASLPESGGKNISAIHWDMVCDMRSGGEITADGELFYQNGEFLI